MKNKKVPKKKNEDVQITVIADRQVRDRLKVLGAMSGVSMGREGGRRLTESIKRDSIKPINLEDFNA